MQTTRPQAQKLDSVGTFYVILLVVLGALALGTYFAVTEVIPAAHNFMSQLTTTPQSTN